MGGNHITNDIAVGLRSSIQDAENVKMSSGCAMSSLMANDQVIQVPSVGGRAPREVSRSVLTKIIEPRVEEILGLVNQEIVQSGYKHLLSAGVVLTGGTSLLEGMTELAEFILEMPVRRGVPQGVGGLVGAVNSPVYSTAVGLLLYGLRQSSHEGGFQFKGDHLYHKVMTRMRSWLSEVF
jgi:cell division protein FtsA